MVRFRADDTANTLTHGIKSASLPPPNVEENGHTPHPSRFLHHGDGLQLRLLEDNGTTSIPVSLCVPSVTTWR